LDLLTGILYTSFLAGGVLGLAALGEVLSERVGVFNLGLEGLMALGGVIAIITVTIVPNPFVGILGSLAIGLVFGAVFATATVLFRANQVLCGLALTIMGTGLSASIGKNYAGHPAKVVFEGVAIPYLSDLPVLGKAFFSQNIMVYVIFIALPIAIHFLMFKTRHGMKMRAVGENPAAADAAGIAVMTIRFWYVTIGASLAAAAGVITSLGFVGQARNWPIAPAMLSTLPYLGTIAFMIVPVFVWKRMQQKMAAPAALGRPYFRDER
jgi:ABC-type uncharacterized transport system permease subunit